VWQPDSFRIRLNRRSTFNYGWDILHEDNGLHFDSRATLVFQLRRLLEDDSLCAQVAAGGKRSLDLHYTLESMIKSYDALYRSLLEPGAV
jgi:hypothetical protein